MIFDSPQFGIQLGRQIANLLPRNFLPFIWRRLDGVSGRLPRGIQYRLRRIASTINRDMGAIEQHYTRWIARYDIIDSEARQVIQTRIAEMTDPPLISIVMPVYNPPPDALRTAIASVQAQLYPRWELCIADDVSTDVAVGTVLREMQAKDGRIKVIRRQRNGHISAASNSALELATGSFVALLDHDDILPSHALYEIAARILSQPKVDMLYSDEDHIDELGRRCHPYFKPDWDPELLFAQNLVSHLGVYRRTLLEEVGGFRIGFEGSQDHDLALRVAAVSRPGAIVHIPKVLYHWRQGTSDQTFSESARERCIINARRAVAQQVAPNGAVEPAQRVPLWNRVIHPMPPTEPLVSILVNKTDIEKSTDSWFLHLQAATTYDKVETIFIDSTNSFPKSQQASVRVAQSLQEAIELAQGQVLLFLQFGLIPTDSGWLREMVSQVIRTDVGVVGAKLLGGDGSIVHAGIGLGGQHGYYFPFAGSRDIDTGYFGHLQLVRTVSAVSGVCMIVRRSVFEKVKGLDHVLEGTPRDIDFCLKVSGNGLRIIWTPYAALRQTAAIRRVPKLDREKRDITALRQKWGRRLDADPYWNPNLAPMDAPVRLAFPPLGSATP